MRAESETQSSHLSLFVLYRMAISLRGGSEMYSGGGDVYNGFGFWGACLVFRFDCISHIKLK